MRIPLSATLGAAAVLAATPAGAGAQDTTGVLTATGGVTITFSGDPARGCVDAGLCGYSGSVQVAPRKRRGQYFLSIEHGHTYGSESYVALTKPAAVVVRRSEGGTPAGTCSDSDEELELYLAARVAKRGRARFELISPDMSTGRCAGPALERALLRLPAHVVPVEQVSSGDATLDMSGQTAFGSGRFSGTISSTLRFHLGRAAPDNERIKARPVAARAHLIRVASLHAVYRIVRY